MSQLTNVRTASAPPCKTSWCREEAGTFFVAYCTFAVMYRVASTLYGLRSGKSYCRYSVPIPYRQHNDLWTSHIGGASPSKDSKLASSKRIISHFLPRKSLEISRARRRGVTATASTALEYTSNVLQAVDIECDGEDADSLMEALLSFGATSCSVQDANLGSNEEEESLIRALFPSTIQLIPAVTAASSSLGWGAPPPYTTSSLAVDQDWVRQIQDSYQAVKVTEGLWVIPSWCEPQEGGELNIILEPAVAFGNGAHPTTRLCLGWLLGAVKVGDKVLDYGCGSGVLAIGARLMGAACAVGVDTDPVAITATKFNASLNGLSVSDFNGYVVDPHGKVEGGVAPLEVFDLVVANILLNPLIDLAEIISGTVKVGGLVGLSGILVEQVPRVQSVYSSYLENMTWIEDEGWAFVSGVKKDIRQL